jgi:FkbM family methyltransferase
VQSAIGKRLSRILVAYYRAPDHPMKVRLWRYVRRALGYRPLTLPYGQTGWMTIDERDWVQLSILSRGTYEPEVWEAVVSRATGDEVVWDVGAHIGTFALRAAQDARIRSVCAFEPDPLTLNVLSRNLALSRSRATVHAVALSDCNERRTFVHGPATNTGMSTLGPTGSTGMTDHVPLATFEVSCRTADDVIANAEAPTPSLMKIDVEGWEYHVLNGAQQLLRSPTLKAIAFEAASDIQCDIEDARLKDLLSRNSYRVEHIPRREGERRGVENYLAARA